MPRNTESDKRNEFESGTTRSKTYTPVVGRGGQYAPAPGSYGGETPTKITPKTIDDVHPSLQKKKAR